jgi:hypothetical protein
MPDAGPLPLFNCPSCESQRLVNWEGGQHRSRRKPVKAALALLHPRVSNRAK